MDLFVTDAMNKSFMNDWALRAILIALVSFMLYIQYVLEQYSPENSRVF